MTQPSSSTNRVASIQVLRGLAALMVVFYHLMFSEQLMSAPDNLVVPALFKTGAAGVDLFFVISGFIMVTVTRKKFGTTGAVPEFLYSRFSRVYPIYWLFTLAILTLGLIKPSLLNIPIGSGWKILESFLLYPQAQFPILKVGWTLVHEIYFYLVFALFLFCSSRFLIKGLMLWAMILILGSITFWSNQPAPAGVLDVLINPLTFEFILGCLIAILIQKPSLLPGWPALIFGLFWFAIAIGFSSHLNVSFLANLTENWLRVIAYGIPAASIVYGMATLEKTRNRVFLPWFQPLGDASYSLYLVHLFILSAMVKIWSLLPWQGMGVKIPYLIAMAGVAIVSGLLIHHLIEKPLLLFTHSLRGRLFSGKSKTTPVP